MVHMVATTTVCNLELSLNARACHHCGPFGLIRRLSCVPPKVLQVMKANSTTAKVSIAKSTYSKSTTGNDVLKCIKYELLLLKIFVGDTKNKY